MQGGSALIMEYSPPCVYQGKRIRVIKYTDWEDVEEPCKGDTPA